MGQGRLAEAREAYQEAIAVSEEFGLQDAVILHGCVAMLLALEERADESLQLLDSIESEIRSLGLDYGLFLCTKARVLVLKKDPEGAGAALNQARAMAAAAEVLEQSRLVRAIRDVEDLL